METNKQIASKDNAHSDDKIYFSFGGERYVLAFSRDENNNITTKLYNKCNVFDFHIVTFLSSNIPSTPVYSVYSTQLIAIPVVAQIIVNYHHATGSQ